MSWFCALIDFKAITQWLSCVHNACVIAETGRRVYSLKVYTHTDKMRLWYHHYYSLSLSFIHAASQCTCVWACMLSFSQSIYLSQERIAPPPKPPPSILIPDKQPWDFKHGARSACDWENGPTGGFSGQGSHPPLSAWLGGWHMVAQAGTPLVWHTRWETHRRPGATQAGPTIAVGDMVSPSFWQRRGSVYVCMCDPILEAATPPPENIGHCPPPHPHGDSAVVSAHQN